MNKIKTLFLGLVFMVAIALMSFAIEKDNKEDILNFKDFEKSLVPLKGNIYACKYEVSNTLYREFINSLIKEGKSDLLKVAMVDSLNWRDKLAYNEPYVQFYFRHPAYDNYPVVNVTYEGANLFCKWLTDVYNANPKRKYKKVTFRLPSEKEWEVAAKGGLDANQYPWGNTLFQNGHYMCNFKQIGDEDIKYDTLTKKFVVEYTGKSGIRGFLNDNADITAPVDSYFPNTFGIYNICGNVAEMVKEKGLCRGGGWKDAGGDVKISSKRYYTKSATDIGFRFFMEVGE